MRCLQDHRYWLAVAAGPVAWLALWLLGLPVDGQLPSLDIIVRVIVVYPVLEELVFRGGIQMLLLEMFPLSRRRIFSLSMANLATSMLFSAMHLYSHAPLWALLVMVPSLVFGWAMEHFGKIMAPVLLHVVYNAGFVLLFM